MNTSLLNGPMYGPRRPSENLLKAMGRSGKTRENYSYNSNRESRPSTPVPVPEAPPRVNPHRLTGVGSPFILGAVHSGPVHGGMTMRQRHRMNKNKNKNKKSKSKKSTRKERKTRRRN